MIKGITTNAMRCPFQPIIKMVNANVSDLILEDGTKAQSATIHEQKTEFGECLRDRCMAFHKGAGVCLKIITVMPELDQNNGEEFDG